MICSSDEIAKQICFNQSGPKIKCVTLDGDVYDPSGLLTGGYTNQDKMLLKKYFEFHKLDVQLNQKLSIQKEFAQKLKELQQNSEYLDGLIQDLESKKYKREKIQEMLKNYSVKSSKDQIDQNQKEIDQLHKEIEKVEKEQEKYKREISELQEEENQLQDQSKNIKEVMLQKILKMEKDLKQLQSQSKTLTQQLGQAEIEKEFSEKEVLRQKEQLKSEKSNMINYEMDIEKLIKAEKVARKDFERIKLQKDEEEVKQRQFDDNIRQLESEINMMSKQLEKLEKDSQKYNNTIDQQKQDLTELEKQIKLLEKSNRFLVEEREELQTLFDRMFDYQMSLKRFTELEHDQKLRQKKINFKVEAMSEKVEKDFESLTKKRATLLDDFTLMNSNIESLDQKKKETLEKCYIQIFSDLLHGAEAKIIPLDPNDVSQGLELAVAFNKVWINSLTELSGGQKSLLALSYVLALLLYKPAPFYILDEVDSALDQSHTENIGIDFPQLQKVDGLSKVDRFVLKQKQLKEKEHKKKKERPDNQKEKEPEKVN